MESLISFVKEGSVQEWEKDGVTLKMENKWAGRIKK